MAKDNKQIAADVLAAVGGPDNVSSVLHCMTRLRFNLKNEGIVDDEQVKAVNGALGVAKQGGQYQVIIGTNVPQVYDELLAMGVNAGGSVDEKLDDVPAKFEWTPKNVGDAVLNYLSGSVVPLIPILITGALFKTLAAVFGSTLLNIFPDDSDFVFVCNQVYNAAFYFMPIVAGFSAASKLKANPFLGAMMGAILMEPSFAALTEAGKESVAVFGLIPAPVAGYAQTLIPVLLCVAALAPIQRFFEKVLPEAIRTIFAPFLTMLVMVPVGMCALAPLGNWIGTGIAGFFFWVAGTPFSWLATALVSALWAFLVLTGMHLGLAAIALAEYATAGQDTLVLLGANISNFVATGVALAIFFRMRKADEKALTMGYIVTQFFGGVGEPLLYGVHLRFKKPWIGQFAGGFAAGLYAALMGVINYTPIQGLFTPLGFLGGTQMNFVHACIAMVLGVVVGFIVTYIVTPTAPEENA